MRAILFFQGPIGREIRTTVRIRWSFVQCLLVYLSIVTHRTCQFWARSEPVNMTKTIESPTKWGVCAVIRFLYSEQMTRNVVLRYCPSWQCSAAYCSCNKEAPEAFLVGSVWSSALTWLCMIFISFLVWNDHRRTTFWHNELQTSVENWPKAQAAGFYDEGSGLGWSIDYVEK